MSREHVQTESCWTPAHSLRHSEGFRAYERETPLGYVDAVLVDDSGDIHSLLVSAGEIVIAVPLAAIAAVDPVAERVELLDRKEARALVDASAGRR